MAKATKGDREYRQLLGFSIQAKARTFLGGQDIKPLPDKRLLGELTHRVEHIVLAVVPLLDATCRPTDIEAFVTCNVDAVLKAFFENRHFAKLNNRGRRPEDVYFNWVRGFALAILFSYPLAVIAGVKVESVVPVGDDDVFSVENFKQTAKADFEIQFEDAARRFELQIGFGEKHDIKKHKVVEGIRLFQEEAMESFIFHIELFNGRGAIVSLFDKPLAAWNFESRSEFEGTEVSPISDERFTWRITDLPPSFTEMRWI